jgi:glycerol kinase
VNSRDKGALLALDQGTTSTRTIAFDLGGNEVARHQLPLKQHYPEPGWVEHDAEEIWRASLAVLTKVIDDLAEQGLKPVCLGITNQRETTVLWDRKDGKPVAKAIVWQDRRTADHCRVLKAEGLEPVITKKTGLLLDPYFSATKLAWILDNDPGLRARAEAGELAFGTVESYLLYRLTGVHGTDVTNASRTMLLNINTCQWDPDLLDIFKAPKALLPEVIDNAFAPIPVRDKLLPCEIAISAMIGDQQAAAIGQGCTGEGSIKSTYGTGCFVLQNTGASIKRSTNRLLATIASRLDGKTAYALEGSIFIAGAVVQWLRDGLRIIEHAEQTEQIAASLDHNHGVYLVPAFTGLGAPHWDPEARGAILGLTRDAGPDHIVRAALEAVAYQTHDLFEAFAADSGAPPKTVRVDGGMAANGWLMQFLSDILAVPVERPMVTETTALGAAFLAGLGAGVYTGLDDIKSFWQLDQRFDPAMGDGERMALLSGWQEALGRVKSGD